ncbi:MAG: RING finger domain-containing protein, partial [Trebouxia sp. A1-2]
VWLTYSGITGYLLYACGAQKKMASTVPRMVYSWFLGCHKACVVIGIVGYALLILEGVGFGLLIGPSWPDGISLMLVWYGLYYGVLGRDLAEVAGDRMVATMGTRRKLSVSVNSCGICSGVLKDNQHLGEELANNEKTVQLTCKHLFHDQCIRGWTLVGKKDTCPVCLEKVDLRALYADRPWDTRNLTWIQMLDAVRYMVVWNPIVLLGLHFALNVLGVTQKQAALHEHSKQLHQLHMNMTNMNMTQSLNGSTTEMLANLTSTF